MRVGFLRATLLPTRDPMPIVETHSSHLPTEKPPMLLELERIEQHLARLDHAIVGTIRWQRARTLLAIAVQVFWIVVFFLAAWQIKTWSENALTSINNVLGRPAQIQDETIQSAKDAFQTWTDGADALKDEIFGTTPTTPPTP